MSEGRDAGANARCSRTGLPERNTGCGAAGVSSLDFFAAGSCGGSGINTVAKNSNAPRAPTDPSASHRVQEGVLVEDETGHCKGHEAGFTGT